MTKTILASLIILTGLACSKPVPIPTAPPVPLAQATKTPEKPKPVDISDEPDPVPYGKIEKRQMQTPDWVSSVAVAQPKITIVNGARYTVDLSQLIVEKVEAALLGTGRFQVAERARIDAVKAEIQTNNDADWFNMSTATTVGKFVGAKYVVLPSVSANVGVFSTVFELEIKILETETGTMVHDYTVRTVSASLDVNSSIRSCVESLQYKLKQALAYDFPARGVIVRVTGHKGNILWIDTRQAAFIRPGMTMRILDVGEVFNPIAQTKGRFFAPIGRALVLSVESAGVVAKVKSSYSEVTPGMVAEVER